MLERDENCSEKREETKSKKNKYKSIVNLNIFSYFNMFNDTPNTVV